MEVFDIEELPKLGRKARLAQLIRLYQEGMVSDLMDRTLYKLFSVEADEERKSIEELRVDLDEFEDRFGMKSSEFYDRFEAGEMGDDADFIEWASYYQMYERAMKRLELLTGAE